MFDNAVALIRGGADSPGLSGEVSFIQRHDGVLVTAWVNGLPSDNPSGFFAFHIHEGKSCSGAGYPETGGHFDPGARPHPEHAGDLPPLLYCGGRAYSQVLTDRFTVSEVIGRTIVIHGGTDDFTSQPSGNAGKKIACGVISDGQAMN
ncbi:MAG: superoxide dismutase family protein [Clostridiales bacterium]|nr:superoxide dismutase family protein [Clostridiales bacterium]